MVAVGVPTDAEATVKTTTANAMSLVDLGTLSSG